MARMTHLPVRSVSQVPKLLLLCATLAGMAGVLSSRAALGREAPPVELHLEAPKGCPSQRTIVERVARLLGRKGGSAPLKADARLQRRDGQWIAEVSFKESQQVVPGDSCAAVAQAVVVILAQAIDSTVRGSFTASRSPVLGQPTESRRALRESSPVSASGESQRPVQFGASVLLLGELGMLPAGSTGPSAFARLRAHRWAAELGFSYLLPLWSPAEGRRAVGAYIRWMAGQLGGCYSHGAALEWGGCIATEVGSLVSSAGGDAGIAQRTELGLWWAGVLSALARARFGSGLAWEIRGGVGIPLLLPSFGADSTLYEPGPASGRLQVGLAWH